MNSIKYSNICIIGNLRKRKRIKRKGKETFEEIVANNFPKLYNLWSLTAKTTEEKMIWEKQGDFWVEVGVGFDLQRVVGKVTMKSKKGK